jgi:hypothetical protein
VKFSVNMDFTAELFFDWTNNWGLRGDPYLWEDLKVLIGKEPLPASVTQLNALLERAFEQIVGTSISSPIESVYIQRYDRGEGRSCGHVCIQFWRERVFPELQKNYLNKRFRYQLTEQSMSRDFPGRTPQKTTMNQTLIGKPCRFEFYPEGCRYGTACRFRHSFPIKPAGKVSPTAISSASLSPTSHSEMSFRSSVNKLSGIHPTSFGAIGGGGLSNNFTSRDMPASKFSGNFQPSSSSGLECLIGSAGGNAFCLPSPRIEGNSRSPSTCIHFLRGKCTFGNSCRFSHF